MNIIYEVIEKFKVNIEKNIKEQREICLKNIENELIKQKIDISKNDYYNNPDFQKYNDYKKEFGMPANLVVEKYLIEQSRLEKIYGPYDLIIKRELTRDERVFEVWVKGFLAKLENCEQEKKYTRNSKKEKKLVDKIIDFEPNQYFYRTEKGLIHRLESLGFEINSFDDKDYIDEKIRLLSFLAVFELKENIKYKSFLGNATLENVSNILTDESTKNGELMKRLKYGLMRGVDESFVRNAKDTIYIIIRKWEEVILNIYTLVDMSCEKSYLQKLSKINYIMTEFLKKYDVDEMFCKKEHDHSLLETFYLKILQHENIARQNDIIDIGFYILSQKNDIEIKKIILEEKYKKLNKELLGLDEVIDFVKKNKKDIAKFVFDKDDVNRNDVDKIAYSAKMANTYLRLFVNNTFCTEKSKVTQLMVYVCIKEIFSLNKQKINNFFYNYKTQDQKTLKAELKAVDVYFKKNQLTLIKRLLFKYNLYLGTINERIEAEKIILKIDAIIKNILNCNNLDDMLDKHCFLYLLMERALIEGDKVKRVKNNFLSFIGNGYTLKKWDYCDYMFFAIMENTRILDGLVLKLRSEIFRFKTNNNKIISNNYDIELEGIFRDKNLKCDVLIEIDSIAKTIDIKDLNFGV